MKTRTIVGLALAVLAIVASMAPTARAGGNGNTPAALSARGWTCVDVTLLDGTDVGVHCFPPGFQSHDASISVKYFDTSDPTSADARYLGTEILIRADLYAGQPCPSSDLPHYLDLNALLGIPYYGCHHPAGGE